jgi:hypothetical protein
MRIGRPLNYLAMLCLRRNLQQIECPQLSLPWLRSSLKLIRIQTTMLPKYGEAANWDQKCRIRQKVIRTTLNLKEGRSNFINPSLVSRPCLDSKPGLTSHHRLLTSQRGHPPTILIWIKTSQLPLKWLIGSLVSRTFLKKGILLGSYRNTILMWVRLLWLPKMTPVLTWKTLK